MVYLWSVFWARFLKLEMVLTVDSELQVSFLWIYCDSLGLTSTNCLWRCPLRMRIPVTIPYIESSCSGKFGDASVSVGLKLVLSELGRPSPERPYIHGSRRLVHITVGSCVLGIAASAVVVGRAVRVVVIVASVALRPGQWFIGSHERSVRTCWSSGSHWSRCCPHGDSSGFPVTEAELVNRPSTL